MGQKEAEYSAVSADIEKIEDTMEHIDVQSFEAAVDIILAAKHVYIIGIRSCKPLAQFLHFYLNMIRGDVYLLDSTSTSETFEQMLRINEKDAVIGISFPRYSIRSWRR